MRNAKKVVNFTLNEMKMCTNEGVVTVGVTALSKSYDWKLDFKREGLALSHNRVTIYRTDTQINTTLRLHKKSIKMHYIYDYVIAMFFI